MRILILMMLFPAALFAQSNEPCKKCSKIVVEVNESPEKVYKDVMKRLITGGFSISESNNELLFVSTDFCQCTKSKGVVTRLNVFVEESRSGSKVTFNGEFNVPDIFETPSKIVNKGMKGSPFKQTWEKMDEIAKSIAQKTSISYYLD